MRTGDGSVDGAPTAFTTTSVRAANRDSVLHVLKSAGAMSRPELAQRTGLTLPTITAIVQELLADQRVMDRGAGPRPSRGGRTPRLVEFNPDAHRVLGIKIGAHRLSVAMGDARGELVDTVAAPMPERPQPAAVVELAKRLVRGLRRQHGSAEAVGVCVPGQIERGTGIALISARLAWTDVPIGHLLSEALQARVAVLNRSQASALAERAIGVSRGIDDLVWLQVGGGIAAGIISGGELLTGTRGLSGELGHSPTIPNGPLCGCGRRGCLEAVVGGDALVREALAADPRLGAKGPLAPEDLVTAAAAGNRVAIEVLVRAGHEIGRATAPVLHLLNPAQVVLGGPVGGRESVFTNAFRQSLAEHAVSASMASTSVLCSCLEGEAALRGALILGYDVLESMSGRVAIAE